MIAEAIIGSVTSIILGSLWLANAITKRGMDREDELDNPKPAPAPKPNERVFPFVGPNGQPCHLCGSTPGSEDNKKISRSYENGYLRRECANCKGSYLMGLATPEVSRQAPSQTEPNDYSPMGPL